MQPYNMYQFQPYINPYITSSNPYQMSQPIMNVQMFNQPSIQNSKNNLNNTIGNSSYDFSDNFRMKPYTTHSQINSISSCPIHIDKNNIKQDLSEDIKYISKVKENI